jgi:hypothetical protein
VLLLLLLLLQVRNSWGSYWGSLGFFKLQRGVNALQIESGDCWWVLSTPHQLQCCLFVLPVVNGD